VRWDICNLELRLQFRDRRHRRYRLRPLIGEVNKSQYTLNIGLYKPFGMNSVMGGIPDLGYCAS